MKRRQFTLTAALSGLTLAFPATARAALSSAEEFTIRLRELEMQAQGRLGMHMLDPASGREYGYRSVEVFLMLSSFKLLASALVLRRADRGEESLQRRIRYARNELVPWSPVTEQHVEAGMTLAQLCEATITTSDNTAANLILQSYGGPSALTAFVRELGDTVTRFDRFEPALNFRHDTEPDFDTTTPRAMLHSMHRVVLGDALSFEGRRLLQQWLLANTTGGKRLKAGLGKNWRIGEKTGTSRSDANDIGVA